MVMPSIRDTISKVSDVMELEVARKRKNDCPRKIVEGMCGN